jgi:hypothetical protein
VRVHKQYRDAWFTAQADYNAHKVEAEFSDDPAMKARWEQADESRLRAQVEAIESEWRVKGFREQVEEAQRVESALGSKSPAKAWGVWNQMFDRDIDSLTDTNNQHFVLSSISPSNALQADEWLKFTLSEVEANQLITQAPAELRNLLSPNSVDLEIESISFEYTSAAISRYWLAQDVFEAHFWKFPDSTQFLSDGEVPPSGRLPAYVVALVFARRVQIKLKENSPRNQAILSQPHAAKPLSLGFFKVAPQAARTMLTSVKMTNTSPTPASPLPAQQSKMNTAFKRMAVKNFIRLATRPSSTVVKVHDHRSTQATTPGRGTAESQFPPEDNDIYILAFICKRLPKCPDPDPTLSWA